MEGDRRPLLPGPLLHDDVDRAAPSPHELPVRRGGAMTQRGARPAGEHGCEPPPFRDQRAVTHGVHAAMHRQQPAALDPRADRSPPESELLQLRVRDDPVLPGRQLRDAPVELSPHAGLNPTRAWTSPPELLQRGARVELGPVAGLNSTRALPGEGGGRG
jgi:hypothetical protein